MSGDNFHSTFRCSDTLAVLRKLGNLIMECILIDIEDLNEYLLYRFIIFI